MIACHHVIATIVVVKLQHGGAGCFGVQLQKIGPVIIAFENGGNARGFCKRFVPGDIGAVEDSHIAAPALIAGEKTIDGGVVPCRGDDLQKTAVDGVHDIFQAELVKLRPVTDIKAENVSQGALRRVDICGGKANLPQPDVIV